MILSRGRGYLFIHIPKTGGTSLAMALEGRAMRDDLMLGDTPKARARRHRLSGMQARGRLWKHSTLSDLEGVLAPGEAQRLFVFTLVRDPVARVLSYYRWLGRQRFDHPAVRLARELPPEGFLEHPMIVRSLRAHPYPSYVTDAGGAERCALFIRLEHFAREAAPLWDHLGFRLALPHLNATAPAGEGAGAGRAAAPPDRGALCRGHCALRLLRHGGAVGALSGWAPLACRLCHDVTGAGPKDAVRSFRAAAVEDRDGRTGKAGFSVRGQGDGTAFEPPTIAYGAGENRWPAGSRKQVLKSNLPKNIKRLRGIFLA